MLSSIPGPVEVCKVPPVSKLGSTINPKNARSVSQNVHDFAHYRRILTVNTLGRTISRVIFSESGSGSGIQALSRVQIPAFLWPSKEKYTIEKRIKYFEERKPFLFYLFHFFSWGGGVLPSRIHGLKI
jgi:hypothetical protein